MDILKRFRKIDVPWVLEVIAERFSFLPVEAMTSESVIYGGAIRDALAGLPLRGDLDIVVSPRHYTTLVKTVDASSFWSRGDFKPGSPTADGETVVIVNKNLPFGRSHSRYGKNVPLEEVTRFVNVRGIELEIIRAKGNLPPEESVIAVPSNVDIICCSLVMDRNGDIYEILESAEDDCKKHLLRFNESVIETVDIPRLEGRIVKLEKRGWKSEIEIKHIKKQQAKAKKRARAAEKKNPKKEKPTEDLWGGLLDNQTRHLMEKKECFAEMYGMVGARVQEVRKIPDAWRGRTREWYNREIEMRNEMLRRLLEAKEGRDGALTKETFEKIENDIHQTSYEMDALMKFRDADRAAPKVEQKVMSDGSVRYNFSHPADVERYMRRYARQTEAQVKTAGVIRGRLKEDNTSWWTQPKRELDEEEPTENLENVPMVEETAPDDAPDYDYDVEYTTYESPPKERYEALIRNNVEEGLRRLKERNRPRAKKKGGKKRGR